MIQPTQDQIIEFLRESNAIEGVYDEDMFQQALYAWEYIMSLDNINTSNVKKVHKILMLHSGLMPNEKGYYRECPVWIGGKEAILYQRIQEHMILWVKEINQMGGSNYRDKELDAKFSHIQYERIHPFVDGNGRTGRMFMNWQRLKKLGLPLLTIHEGHEQMVYYKWFT